MIEVTDKPERRFQFRLLDLLFVVVGASYVMNVARRSRIAWGGVFPDLAHAFGLIVLTLCLLVGMAMIRRGILRKREGRNWAVLWRIVAIAWMSGSILKVAAALQIASPANTSQAFGDTAAMQLRLASLTTCLGMIGLVLAMIPIAHRPAGRKPRFGSWLSVTLGALVGIVVLALGHGCIPYLVLIAMEAVHNAMSRAPLIARPILFDRLLTTSLEAMPGLLGCLATAAWVDDDLRSAVGDPAESRSFRSWRGVLVRTATMLLAVSGAAYTMLVSTPKLSPPLAEGLWAVLTPSTMATIGFGFAALAAGLSARSAGYLTLEPFVAHEAPAAFKWPRRILLTLAGLLCLEITAGAVQVMTHDLEDRWYIPVSLSRWSDIIQAAIHWLGQPAGVYGWQSLADRPDDFLILGSAIWLTIKIAILAMSMGPAKASPLDAIISDRLAFGRFLGWWLALSVAMVASLPGFAAVGVTLIHFVILWTAK